MKRAEGVDVTARVLHLRSIPVGASLPQSLLTRIAHALHDRHFAAGESLMREGEPIGGLHLLRHGRVALSRQGKPMGELAPPQSLGFLGIVAGADGTYDATCTEDTTTLELDTDALLGLIEDRFEFYYATLKYVAERLYYDMQDLPPAALGSAPDLAPTIPDAPLDWVARMFVARTFSGFKNANVNSLARLARSNVELRYPAGAPIWRVGDRAENVLFMVAGTVRCTAASGKTFVYGPGFGVGGVDLVADKPRWYAAVAETPVLALAGRADGFVDLLEHDFTLAKGFLESLASGLLALTTQRAAANAASLAQRRDVSSLRNVPVGA